MDEERYAEQAYLVLSRLNDQLSEDDATVGKAIRELPDNVSIDVNLKWYGAEVIDFRTPTTRVYQGKSAYAALVKAGFIKERDEAE